MKLMKTQDATDVVAHDVSPLVVPTDSRNYSLIGWAVVIFGVVGFFIWASFAPLDKGVPVSGNVAVSTNRKAVQHLSGGTIDEILVKEGERVKAGQVLVKMNDTRTKAEYLSTRSVYFTTLATQSRLHAERDGAKTLVMPEALKKEMNDPQVAAVFETQRQLFASRTGSLRDEMSAIEENIAGLKAQLAGMKESAESRKEQQVLLKEQLASLRDLAKDGYVARNRVIELERQASQTDGSAAEERGNMIRLTRQISELQLRRTVRQQDYQREVRTLLSDVSRDVETLINRLRMQELDLNNSLVRSPADGVVVAMAVFTQGGVITPGFRMMDIVPSVDSLVVEGQIPVNLIDKVHPGMDVELIFSAFNQNTTPHIPGKITTVSADRIVDERTGVPYYKMQAHVTPEGMKIIERDKLNLRPGMPAELFVHTGSRTMMNYLLKPITDRAKTAVSED